MSEYLGASNRSPASNPQSMSRSELRARTVDGRGLADIRLLKVEDGPGRGQRLLVIRNAAGIGLEIALDRGFDISSLTWRGANIGWNSANGLPWPAHPIDAEDGIGFYRNLDGFLVTCGLDHVGGAMRTGAEHFIHKHRREVFHPLHGRISSQRATLSGYGINWDGAVPVIWAEGVVKQSAAFGENLTLRRRVEVTVFGTQIDVRDTVENTGFRPTSHAMLYHVNFGYPFLDEATQISGDLSIDMISAFNEENKLPRDDLVDWYQDVPVASGLPNASVELHNRALLGGIRAKVTFSPAELPSFGVWRAFQSGVYALALEPARRFDPDLNSPCTATLRPGEAVNYGIGIALDSISNS